MDNIRDGVYPTMITPFTQDNKIDFSAVERLLEWYAERNVGGIFAVCQSSEMFFLSIDERVSLVRFIRRNLPRGLSLIASGHVADTMAEQVSDAEKIVAEGIDAYAAGGALQGRRMPFRLHAERRPVYAASLEKRQRQ